MTEPDGTGQTVLELMRTMGAVRDFADRPVPDAVLHDILDHARFAPGGANQQPWHVIIIDDPPSNSRSASSSNWAGESMRRTCGP